MEKTIAINFDQAIKTRKVFVNRGRLKSLGGRRGIICKRRYSEAYYRAAKRIAENKQILCHLAIDTEEALMLFLKVFPISIDSFKESKLCKETWEYFEEEEVINFRILALCFMARLSLEGALL